MLASDPTCTQDSAVQHNGTTVADSAESGPGIESHRRNFCGITEISQRSLISGTRVSTSNHDLQNQIPAREDYSVFHCHGDFASRAAYDTRGQFEHRMLQNGCLLSGNLWLAAVKICSAGRFSFPGVVAILRGTCRCFCVRNWPVFYCVFVDEAAAGNRIACC